jgi:hypothetical protein
MMMVLGIVAAIGILMAITAQRRPSGKLDRRIDQLKNGDIR